MSRILFHTLSAILFVQLTCLSAFAIDFRKGPASPEEKKHIVAISETEQNSDSRPTFIPYLTNRKKVLKAMKKNGIKKTEANRRLEAFEVELRAVDDQLKDGKNAEDIDTKKLTNLLRITIPDGEEFGEEDWREFFLLLLEGLPNKKMKAVLERAMESFGDAEEEKQAKEDKWKEVLEKYDAADKRLKDLREKMKGEQLEQIMEIEAELEVIRIEAKIPPMQPPVMSGSKDSFEDIKQQLQKLDDQSKALEQALRVSRSSEEYQRARMGLQAVIRQQQVLKKELPSTGGGGGGFRPSGGFRPPPIDVRRQRQMPMPTPYGRNGFVPSHSGSGSMIIKPTAEQRVAAWDGMSKLQEGKDEEKADQVRADLVELMETDPFDRQWVDRVQVVLDHVGEVAVYDRLKEFLFNDPTDEIAMAFDLVAMVGAESASDCLPPISVEAFLKFAGDPITEEELGPPKSKRVELLERILERYFGFKGFTDLDLEKKNIILAGMREWVVSTSRNWSGAVSLPCMDVMPMEWMTKLLKENKQGWGDSKTGDLALLYMWRNKDKGPLIVQINVPMTQSALFFQRFDRPSDGIAFRTFAEEKLAMYEFPHADREYLEVWLKTRGIFPAQGIDALQKTMENLRGKMPGRVHLTEDNIWKAALDLTDQIGASSVNQYILVEDDLRLPSEFHVAIGETLEAKKKGLADFAKVHLGIEGLGDTMPDKYQQLLAYRQLIRQGKEVRAVGSIAEAFGASVVDILEYEDSKREALQELKRLVVKNGQLQRNGYEIPDEMTQEISDLRFIIPAAADTFYARLIGRFSDTELKRIRTDLQSIAIHERVASLKTVHTVLQKIDQTLAVRSNPTAAKTPFDTEAEKISVAEQKLREELYDFVYPGFSGWLKTKSTHNPKKEDEKATWKKDLRYFRTSHFMNGKEASQYLAARIAQGDWETAARVVLLYSDYDDDSYDNKPYKVKTSSGTITLGATVEDFKRNLLEFHSQEGRVSSPLFILRGFNATELKDEKEEDGELTSKRYEWEKQK